VRDRFSDSGVSLLGEIKDLADLQVCRLGMHEVAGKFAVGG
jgi:hypothetical protein